MERRCSKGFTLIELIVVIAVISILAGTLIPLVSATQRARHIDTVLQELETIADALDSYYFENGSFPSSLTASGFYGSFLLPGVEDARIKDEWGGGYYKVFASSDPDVMTVYSVGENGRDDGASSETFKVVVRGEHPGNRRTRERMRIIASVLAVYLSGGGILTGTWSTDRAAMGLGSEYQKDGFGTDFTLSASTLLLRSAGADRSFNTSDDLTL